MGRYSGKRCRLMSMFILTTSFFFIEIIVGYITNSVALVADSFHMLSDVIALIIAFLSVQFDKLTDTSDTAYFYSHGFWRLCKRNCWMSPKKWSKNTFGWARAEVLGALVNAVFLVALCFSIFIEALKRLYDVDEIHNPKLILYVGCAGLLVNVVGLFLFHEHGHGHSHRRAHHRSLPTIEEVLAEEDINENHENYRLSDNLPNTVQDAHGNRQMASGSQMNMRGVFLHVLADALGSVIVIISALIIWLTEWEYRFYVDPALSIIMVCLIMKSTWPLLVESALILLQTVPTHIQIDSLQKKLLQEIDGVLAVHEFHVWQLAGERIIASAHIRCRNLVDYMQIAEKVKEFFHNEGIHSTTIQPEFVDIPSYQEKEENCILDCPASTNCTAQTCCGPQKEGQSPQTPRSTPVCRQRLNNGNNTDSYPDEVTLALEAGDVNASSSSSSSKNVRLA